jgi:hypothetical protein
MTILERPLNDIMENYEPEALPEVAVKQIRTIVEKFLKNQRPPVEVTPAPSRGHPHTPKLVVVADFKTNLLGNGVFNI